MSGKKFFYGKAIPRKRQQEYVEFILKPFRQQPASEELRRHIIDTLNKEKFEGRLLMPFQVVLHKDPTGQGSDYIDVILESKT